MLNIKLPKKLEDEYNSIRSEFTRISNDWEEYEDQIIPEDPKFAKRIINFIIGVIDYILDNFDTLDVNEYQEFLANYDYEFFYGPNGDDNNYLDFDEKLDDQSVTEFCWELKDQSNQLSKERLNEIKNKYLGVLNQFNV